MSTDYSNINDSINTQTSVDGFLYKKPYCYSWTTNAKGVNVPVIPYVISILEPQSLDKNEEKILKHYLKALIKQWKWENTRLIILSNMSGKTGEIVSGLINNLRGESTKNSKNRDPYSFVFAVDHSDFYPQSQEGANEGEIQRDCTIHPHMTIVFKQRENDLNNEQNNAHFKEYLESLISSHKEITINSVLHIQSNSSNAQNAKGNCSPVIFYKSIKELSKRRFIKYPSKIIAILGISKDLDQIEKINKTSVEDHVGLRIKDEKKIDILSNNNHDASTKQIYDYSLFFQHLSNDCKKKTKKYINRFCMAFLFIFMCNAFIVYINNICISGLGVNVVQLTRYSFVGNEQNFFFDNVITKVGIRTKISYETPIIPKIESLNESYIDLYLFKISKTYLICIAFLIVAIASLPPIIVIIRCIYVYLIYSWPDKYHKLQTLSDFLKIQAFWRYVGITKLINEDNLLSKQAHDCGWLLITLNGIYSTVPFDTNNKNDYSENIEYLNNNWIKNSIEHYSHEIKKTEWSTLCLSSIICVFFWSVLTIFFLFFFIYSYLPNCDFVSRNLYALFTTILLFTAAGVVFCCSRLDSSIGVRFQYLIRRLKRIDIVTAVLTVSVIVCCIDGILELIRLSYLCSKAQTSFLDFDYNFRNISEEFRLILQLFIAFILVVLSYLRMHMFYKERKIISQLLYSFKNATSSIQDILTNVNTQNQLVNQTVHHNRHLSRIITNSLYDCMINDSDISTVIENIKSQVQPEANENANKSFLRRLLSSIYSFLTRKSWKEKQRLVLMDDFILRFEKELNKLANAKEAKLSQLKAIDYSCLDKPIDNNEIIQNKCRDIILELGQEYLIKRIDWLLAVKERDIHKIK